MRILKICPRSAHLYIQLWRHKNQKFKLTILREDIRKTFALTPTIFRNLITPLAYMGIITFKETEHDFKLDLIGKKND